jgi:hypothetical protein
MTTSTSTNDGVRLTLVCALVLQAFCFSFLNTDSLGLDCRFVFSVKMKAALAKAKVLVCDDPQTCGLIPEILKINKDAKIIFRSHIQLDAESCTKTGTPQNETWKFLHQFIKLAHVFVSHPVKGMVPSNIPEKQTYFMPATTDPMEYVLCLCFLPGLFVAHFFPSSSGLNKPLTKKQISTYIEIFNALLKKTGQTELDLRRPSIVQIARFDPSKAGYIASRCSCALSTSVVEFQGIPDVLEAYAYMRTLLFQDDQKPEALPQLILAGHGSVDDPEGREIYEQTRKIIRDSYS